ncbi:MAG TPA: EamA family transporter [Amycolatopsis sp.]|uniref:DMT family transporter n=1 Tax=Amycolatopsis sp. TaxID=37632 RepID=UPI002B469930|nr:EamA family transporter [Amycolatopsis sp.]HKS48725.1 EamA family transporter [Amycolatopsis sp.]
MPTFLAAPARGRSASALILAGILWGTGGLSGSLLAAKAGLRPLPVATYRLLLGGGAMMVFLALSGGLRQMIWTIPLVRRLLAAGVLLGLFQACYFAAVSLTSVSIATMITIGSVPVFVALATSVRERRRPGNTTIVSITGAVFGLVLLTWSPEGIAGGWRLVGGVALALLCATGFGTLTLLSRSPVDGLDPLRTTAFGLLVGGLLLAPAALWSGMALPLRLDVFGAACYLGIVPTAVAYAAYFRGLRHAPPVVTALSALLEPLTAAVLSAFLLHDQLGVTGWCGTGLLVAALGIGYSRG